ncbi:MAG TPA: LysR family transcriptional regulator [Mobilitalea sp.]|nr:LysR family transcriptional regulator [Mobilitalea sp.]
MTPSQIEYMLVLAEERSFSKAAKRLNVTQPSLSQLIQNLEGQLDVQLFDRSTCPIRLTQAGEIFVDAALKMKLEEKNMMKRLSDLQELKTGSLKIGTTPFRASCLLSKSIAAFQKRYGGVAVSVVEGNLPELEAGIINGTLDLVICPTPSSTSGYHIEELATEKVYLALTKDNPLNEALKEYRLMAEDIRVNSPKLFTTKPVPFSAFANEKFILLEHSEYDEQLITSLCDKSNMEPRGTLCTKHIETAFSFALSGLGAALIPDTYIRFGNIAAHPFYYEIDDKRTEQKLVLISKRNSYLSKAAKEYCLILKQLISIGTWKV